jgi:hypothetical protein
MVKVLKWMVLSFIAVVGVMQFVQPPRENPTVDASRTMYAMTDAPPQVRQILDRSCRDCHTNETTWPWYSNVAPVSWVIAHDVDEGRRHLNFSDWAAYSDDDAAARLLFIELEVRSRTMPPESYLRLHPDAKLSDHDVEALTSWIDTRPR